MITLANAPVSYGIFSLARPDLVSLPSGPALLDDIKAAGYSGVDLGPHGLFGVGDDLVAALRAHSFGLAGGWLDFPFAASQAHFDAAWSAAQLVLDDMALVGESIDAPAPKPTIADSGSDLRRAHPGGGPGTEVNLDTWHVITKRIEFVANEVRARSLEPTFHHHAATHIETVEEIDRLLSDTSIDLTFDTGHLMLGGGDPIAHYSRWSDRINHVHLKDVDTSVLHGAKGSDNPVRDIWERRVFVALGQGDVDVPAFMELLVATNYHGWIVIEQDVVLRSADDVAKAVADQEANRSYIHRWVR